MSNLLEIQKQVATEVITAHGHVPGDWLERGNVRACACLGCGMFFMFDTHKGVLVADDEGQCPKATSSHIIEHPVEITTIRGSDVMQKIETDHPLLPEGVTYWQDPDWMVSPEGNDMWPVIGSVVLPQAVCPSCQQTVDMRGRKLHDHEEKLWACAQCPNCRLYHWYLLVPKEGLDD